MRIPIRKQSCATAKAFDNAFRKARLAHPLVISVSSAAMEFGMRATILGLVLGTLVLGRSVSNAQEVGDPQTGRTFAREACASCHAIQPGQMTSLRASAPPFQQVADTPGMTGTALTVWLQTSHPTMPNLQLTLAEKGDVIAYILSLRTARN